MRDYEAIKKSCQARAERRAFICERFPKDGIGAEIGVFYGQFSKIILEVAKPELLYLVDPWLKDDPWGDRTPKQMNEIAHEVLDKFAINPIAKIVRSKSDEFFELMEGIIKIRNKKPNWMFDFIYIDGSHEYQDVLSDLEGAWKIVKPGGIIAGDDYGENILVWGDTIKRAVDDFCWKKSITPEIIDVPGENGKQFLIRR